MHLSRSISVAALMVFFSTLSLADRKNARDFPNSTMCPIHLGWEVALDGTPDPNSDPRIQEGLTFVAEGRTAVVTFLACDRKDALIDEADELETPVEGTTEVRVDDVALVREDVFRAHQKATSPSPTACYFGADPFPALAVGSVFDRAVTPRVYPFTKALPFADDFSDVARSKKLWRLGGGELDATAGNLVLSRESRQTGGAVCSAASFKAGGLVQGQSYVLDFKWRVTGIDGENPVPLSVLMTYFDLSPGR